MTLTERSSSCPPLRIPEYSYPPFEAYGPDTPLVPPNLFEPDGVLYREDRLLPNPPLAEGAPPNPPFADGAPYWGEGEPPFRPNAYWLEGSLPNRPGPEGVPYCVVGEAPLRPKAEGVPYWFEGAPPRRPELEGTPPLRPKDDAPNLLEAEGEPYCEEGTPFLAEGVPPPDLREAVAAPYWEDGEPPNPLDPVEGALYWLEG